MSLAPESRIAGEQGPPRRSTRRAQKGTIAHGPRTGVPREDQQQTRRDLRAALVFGIVAATIELGAILYFFR